MGRRGYPPEFRGKVLDLVAAGRSVVDVARDLGISAQSIYVWREQDRIDKGLEPGPSSAERSELSAAKRRITELETELVVHPRASELPAKVGAPKKAVRSGRGDGRRGSARPGSPPASSGCRSRASTSSAAAALLPGRCGTNC